MVRLLHRIVVEKFVDNGSDCVEALKLRLLAEQGGDVSVPEASAVVACEVEGYDADVAYPVRFKDIGQYVTS